MGMSLRPRDPRPSKPRAGRPQAGEPRTGESVTELSAAELNTRIRELWADGELPDDRRPEYESLVMEWAAAAREDVERAA
jgi:hypothetical protein